jgi:hypothetical protein
MNDYEKQQKLYNASTIIFSKPLYYGGCNFIKYNSITKKYVTGNTASTAVSSSAGVSIDGVLTRDIKQLAKRLEYMGYTEHKIKWTKGIDTYESIHKAGL